MIVSYAFPKEAVVDGKYFAANVHTTYVPIFLGLTFPGH